MYKKEKIIIAILSTLASAQVAVAANGYTSSTQQVPAPAQPIPPAANGYSSNQTPNHPPVAAHGPTVAPRHGYSSSQTPQQKHHKRHRHDDFSIRAAVPGFVGGVVIGSQGGHFYVEEEVVPPAPGLQWIQAFSGRHYPVNTVVGGGENGRPLFVCHARYNGSLHPGKVVNGRCNITYAGKEIAFNRYQILVSNLHLGWLPASFGSIPPNAISGGFENGHPLMICQAQYAGSMHPGKLVGQACNIGYDGREITLPYYNVLVA